MDVNEVESAGSGQPLPRRDWILLPLLSLLTLVFLGGAAEVGAGLIEPVATTTLRSCLTTNDPAHIVKGIAGSHCFESSLEAGHVDYSFDGMGYRNKASLAPKDPGTFRIVLTGSSIAFGDHVAAQKDIASTLVGDLAGLTGKRVEIYNEGMELGFPRSVSLRMKDLISAKPDLIIWVFGPYDIEHADQLEFTKTSKPPATHGFSEWVKDSLKYSHAGNMATYLLFKSPSSPLKAQLMAAGSSDYLRAQLSPAMQRDMVMVDEYAGGVVDQSRAAGIPVVATFVPSRSQAAMISMGHWPSEYDPYELGRQVQAIMQKHGGDYVDILSSFRNVPNAEQHFFPIANHPDAEGDRLISEFLAAGMVSGAHPALRARDAAASSVGGF